MNWIKARVRDWWVPVSLTLFLYILLRCIFLVGYVPSESMEPTLHKGSLILCTRITKNLETGDIIVFRRGAILMVKRIAAVGGDTVDYSRLEYMEGIAPPQRSESAAVVPENSFFLLGDNTQDSLDSRYWDNPFIHSDDVVAKLLFVGGKEYEH